MKLLLLLITAASLASCSSTIYLVRHADKPLSGSMAGTDPDLTDAGRQRALALRDSMANKGITSIFSTPFKRTQQTAQPTATSKNITITTYQNAVSDSLIEAIASKQNKNTLVVGHSDNVPAMLRHIGLNPSMQVINDPDFDNLFIVSIQWFFGRRITLKEKTYGVPSP